MKKVLSMVLLLVFAVSALAQEAPRKYGMKSGIVKVNSSVMGQNVESTVYFEDYGALEANKTKTSIPGAGEIEVSTVTKDGKTYAVIPSLKQVQEQPAQESINYMDLTDEVIAKYKIEKVGTETVCGKECTKYTEEVTQQGMSATATVWVYKGFPMKSVTSVAGLEVVTEVVELTEDAFIVASVFEIPTF